MKKIVVMSDSHGYHEMIDYVYNQEKDSDFFVHCGDSEADDERMKGWITVRGNNDWMSDFENEIIFQVDDLRFLVCHGHKFGYFDREMKMLLTLQENDCDVLLSGHTHVPMCIEEDGKYLINPGSTTLPRGGSDYSYCVLYVDGKNLEINFKKID